MAIRDISSEMMVKLSAAWIDHDRQRPLLQSVPLVAAILTSIDEAHQGLLDTQPRRAAAPIEAEIGEIQRKQVAVDTVHDRKMRGTFGLLTALAAITDDPAAATRYLELRDNLCPKGLRGTNQTYAEEAGAARLLPARLSDDDEKLMAAIPLPGGRLHDAVHAWTRAAMELEQLDDKKRALIRQLERTDAIRPADALQARYRWQRVARGLEANLALSESTDAATVQAILGPLQDASKKAERRKAPKATESAQAEAPAEAQAPGEEEQPAAPETTRGET